MHELKGGSSRHIFNSYITGVQEQHTHVVFLVTARKTKRAKKRERSGEARSTFFFYRRYKYDDDDAATKTILLCFFSSFVLRFCVVVLSNCRECVRVAGEIFPESVRSRDVFKSRNDEDDEIIFNFLS